MATMLSTFESIRLNPLFSELKRSQAEPVTSGVVRRRFKRGEEIVEQGQKSDTLTIILTGRARVITTDHRGREGILAMLQPAAFAGEMSLIDEQPHSPMVRADLLTNALILRCQELPRCLTGNNSMACPVM